MADSSSSVRAKQSTAANFKANCHTEKGKQEISGFLDGVLSLQRSFDVERQEWCLWLIAGGKRPEEFRNVLLSYDTPTICGLVWNKNFVAYRCRDCGISPCMSLCADCFHAGNHEGHDFNMFKSQAGGACDCGDEDVMKKEGCVNSCFLFIFLFYHALHLRIHPEGLKGNKLRFQSILEILISDFDENSKRQRKLYIKIIRSAQIKFRNCIVLSVNCICEHSFEFFKIRRYLTQS